MHWTENILSCHPEQVEHMITAQQHVGEVHARISIPIQLVEMGTRTLKAYLFT